MILKRCLRQEQGRQANRMLFLYLFQLQNDRSDKQNLNHSFT